MSTTVTLRPDGTINPPGTNGIVTVGGGSTIHGNTSDNNTSTGVKATAEGAWCDLTLTGTTLTSVQRVRSAKIRAYVARTAAGSGLQRCSMYLRDSDGTNSNVIDLLGTSSSAGTELTGAERHTLAGREFTQTRVNAMRLALYWRLLGSVQWLEVRELYVDLDVRTRPSVASVTVTNYTTSTRPNIAWTPTTDVDPVSRWQAKVFSAAQYGTTGFNPASSASTWDSGVMLGDVSAVDLTKDLVNGVMYKAWVGIAVDWTGTPDWQWWSDWSAAGAVSSAFTVALAPPAAPALSVSALTGLPNYRALLDLTAYLNLLTADNASVEGSIGQWAADTNCTVSRVSTDAADGTWSMQTSSSAAGTMAAILNFEPILGVHVKGGAQYTALASVRSSVGSLTARVDIVWHDAAGAFISTDVGSTVVPTTSGYTQCSVTATAPANAKQAKLKVETFGAGAAGVLTRWDKMDLHAGSSTSWTPGGMSSQTLVVERGERVGNGRGGAENWAHPDVASAGSVARTSGNGFGLRNDSGRDSLGWEWLDKDIAGGAPSGMIHWSVRSGITTAELLIGEFVYGGPPGEEWKFPAVVGQTHVWSFWAWVATGTLAVTPKIEWRGDDTTVTIGTPSGSPVTLTTTPQRVTVTGTCPANASAANGILTNHTGSASGDVYVTRVGWGLGPTPVDDKPASGGPLVWSAVRGVSSVNVAGFPVGYDTGQRVLVADPECPPGRPVLYRARQTATLAGQAIASANSAYATAYLTPPSRTILRDALHPEQAVVAGIAPADERSISEDGQTFHPLGRDGGPVKVRDWQSGHDGSYAMTALSDAELAALETLLGSATELLVQHSEGGQTYLLVTGYSSTRVVRSALHRVTVNYLESARP